MNKINFTNSQKDAVEIAGGNVIVSAAAGSGKTAVLAQKVVDMLTRKENPIMADRIIIVTFTVAAADEMRRRIHLKISDLIKEDSNNRLLQKQSILLDSAKICTIHSLCSFIIRDYFQELSLPSNITIADETQMSVLQKEALTEVIDKFYEKEDIDFLKLADLFIAKDDREITNMILDIYKYIRSLSFPIKYLKDSLDIYKTNIDIHDNIWFSYTLPHVIKGIEFSIAIINKALQDIESDEVVKNAYYNPFYTDFLCYNKILEYLYGNEIFKAIEYYNNYKKEKLSPVKGYDDKKFLEQIKKQRNYSGEIVEKLFKMFLQYTREDFKNDNEIIYEQLKILFLLVEDFYILLEEKKQNINKMDYSDLEHYTLKLLLNDNNKKSQIAQDLSLYYEYIMIDECQDINEIQNLIFALLSREEKNLFMVGDLKQSIYRFRNAMPQLFIDKMDEFKIYNKNTHDENSSAKIILDYNFRSSNDICNIVNFIFSSIMTRDIGEVDYNDGQALIPNAVYYDEDSKIPELHILDYYQDDNNDEYQDKTMIEYEAQYIAKMVNKMISEEFSVTENNISRPCCAKDFVILLRSQKDKAAVYSKALDNLNINNISEKSEGYFNQYEIQVVLNLLRVIYNPMLDIAMLSVLLSPIGGFSPDDIVKIRLKEKNKSIFSGMLRMDKLDNQKTTQFLDMIRYLREKSITMSCDEVIQEIYDITDFLSLVYAMGDGQQKSANLRLLLVYAQKYNEIGNGSIGGFLRYIDKIIELKDGKFSLASLIPDNINAVKIITIHGSKGLEFPICILANCAKQFNCQDINRPLIQKHNKLGIAIKILDKEKLKKYTSLSFEAIRLKNKKELISEEMRMLYVALTRAKEKLIIVGTMKDAKKNIHKLAQNILLDTTNKYYVTFKSNSYLDWLIIALIEHDCLKDFRIQNNLSIQSKKDISQGRIKFLIKGYNENVNCNIDNKKIHTSKSDEDLKLKLYERFNFIYDRYELIKLPAKVTVTKLAKKQQVREYSLSNLDDILSTNKITREKKGTILHRFMQFADFDNARNDIYEEINRLIVQKFMTKDECDYLDIDSIKLFLQSDLFKQMQKSKEVKREYKFLYFINAGEIDYNLSEKFKKEKVLLQGIADCLIFEDDGIIIVDYKTDQTNNEQVLHDRYQYQIKLYSDAISKAFKQKVKQGVIYSLYLNKSIEIDISNY